MNSIASLLRVQSRSGVTPPPSLPPSLPQVKITKTKYGRPKRQVSAQSQSIEVVFYLLLTFNRYLTTG